MRKERIDSNLKPCLFLPANLDQERIDSNLKPCLFLLANLD